MRTRWQSSIKDNPEDEKEVGKGQKIFWIRNDYRKREDGKGRTGGQRVCNWRRRGKVNKNRERLKKETCWKRDLDLATFET